MKSNCALNIENKVILRESNGCNFSTSIHIDLNDFINRVAECTRVSVIARNIKWFGFLQFRSLML